MSHLPPPIPLGYSTPEGPPPPPDAWGTAKPLLLGLGIGSLVSFVAWVGGWQSTTVKNSAAFGWLMLVIPGAKFVTGVVLLCLPGKRALGGGILLSIAVGFLIFFGACAMSLSHS